MNVRPLAVTAILFVLPACGDSAPSKEAYLGKADPACRPATAEATAMTTPTDVAGLRQFHVKLAEGAERTVAELEKLKVPGGDDGKAAKAMVQSLRDAAAAARAVPPEVDKVDYGAIESAARKAADAFRAADTQARTVGSKECGRGEADAVGRMATALPKAVKSAYITAVDAFCKATFDEYEKLEDPETLPEIKAFFERIVALDERLLTDMKSVKPPLTDKDKLDAAIAAVDKMLAKEKEVLAAAAAGDERETDDQWSLLDTITSDVEAKMNAYGFIECGSGSS